MSRDIVITGKVEAYPGSGGSGTVKFENIQGSPYDNTNLRNALNAKENNDTQKIKEFFESHEDFGYKFLISIANKPVTEVTEYVELILREFALHSPVAMVPYDVGKMALILKVNDPTSGETFRCLIPSIGQILSVSMVDASGLVKFAYRYIGDDGETARWGKIEGNIEDQSDLGENFLDTESNIKNSEIEALFG